MSNKGNPYKVGLFILIAFVLLAATLLSLGIMKYFRETFEFMTILTTSAQGLEKGAKVKLSGVTIGRVAKIQLDHEGQDIYVFMEFDPDAFAEKSIKPLKLPLGTAYSYFKQRVKENVEKGLRCQLQYGDITGSVFVELAYLNPNDNPLSARSIPEDFPPYIPSIPSVSIGNVIVDFQKAAVRIGKVDFERLSTQLGNFLETSNKFFEDAKTKEMLADARAFSGNLKAITNDVKDTWSRQRLEEFNKNFNEALCRVDQAMKDIGVFTKETASEIKSAHFEEATKKSMVVLDSSQNAITKLDGLQDDLRQAVRKLDDTLRSAKSLIDYLQKQPESLLSGKPDERVVSPR